MLDVSDADSFFRYALNVKLLSRNTPRSSVNADFLCVNKKSRIPGTVFDQVEKGHTSLLSAFKNNFQTLLQITTEFTTDWAAVSAFSFVRAVVRIEKSSPKSAITTSSLSKELM